MACEPTWPGEPVSKNASSPSAVVVSRDSDLVEAIKATCRRLELGFEHVKSASRLAKGDLLGNCFAIVWDGRHGGEEWPEAGVPAADAATVIALGCHCPTGRPARLRAISLPAESPAETVAQTVAAVAEGFLAKRRAEEAGQALRDTQRRLEEGAKATKALRDQVGFYELQRNQLSEFIRGTAYLGQLSKEINCLDVEKILDICVTKVPRIVDASLASVYMVSEETGELVLKRSNHSYRITDRLPIDSSVERLMTLALERKATLLIRDINTFAKGLGKPIDRTYAGKYRTRSCIVAPLINDNRVIAVLNLADKTSGAPFDEVRDLPLVDHISQFIGTALRNCQLYEKVWHLAKTDALTGFMNHNAFFDELHREIARVRRNKTNLSLVLLDVDNFKLFNDVHGHQVGDMILSQVSGLIRSNVRTVDSAARYGGDEFAVILADTDLERAEIVAERIRRAIAANQLTLEGQTFFVTISAGIAQYRMGQTLADIVNEADAALYRAKSKGRNVVTANGQV